MRCQRVKMSISVWSSMCPMCNEPVTFGGGITIEKTGPGFAGSALNNSSFTQHSAHFGSISFGSYALAISRPIPLPLRIPRREASLALLRHAHFLQQGLIFDYTVRRQSPSIQPYDAMGASGFRPHAGRPSREHRVRLAE